MNHESYIENHTSKILFKSLRVQWVKLASDTIHEMTIPRLVFHVVYTKLLITDPL